MLINITDAGSTSGFYVTDFEIFAQTLSESKIIESFELGGVAIHHVTRNGESVWLLDNPLGKYGIWVEEKNGHSTH